MSLGISLTFASLARTSKQSRRRRLGARVDGIRAAVHLKARDQADDLLLRVGEAVDELGQVVFEEALAVRREEGHDGVVVGEVRGDEAVVAGLAILVQALALETCRSGAVLGVGE